MSPAAEITGEGAEALRHRLSLLAPGKAAMWVLASDVAKVLAELDAFRSRAVFEELAELRALARQNGLFPGAVARGRRG